jgi:hypothetical protein
MRGMKALAMLGLLLPGAALADHPFILPSATNIAGDGTNVTFDAAGADHVFFFDHRPIQLASIKVTRPDGTPGEPYNAAQMRLRSVLDVKLDQQGTWKVASELVMVIGTFKQNGEERRVGGRPAGMGGMAMGGVARGPGAPAAGHDGPGGDRPAALSAGAAGDPRRQPPVALQDLPVDATDLHLVEQIGRTETFVTAGAPTTTVFKPTGKGLELAPITHPNALVAGETARFRFLVDGKPAASVTVTVLAGGDRYRDDAGEKTLTTDRDGVVAVTWPTAGMYWLGAEAQDRNPAEKRAEARRMSYAATLEVMTP